jgi:hypothetical protein
LRVGYCVCDGVCPSGWVVQVGFPSWGGQVEVYNASCAGRVVIDSWFPFIDGVSLPTTSR